MLSIAPDTALDECVDSLPPHLLKPRLLTGAQALVALTQLQAHKDRARGLRTRGYVSGYRGSPLAALDAQFEAKATELEASGIVFRPGLNEDLAATACQGTQEVPLWPGAQVQGVFALWYGKGPGVDRSGDALKHANYAGTSPLGGVVMAVGDDHGCHSSSMPHQSDVALMAAGIPTLFPTSVAEIVSLGLQAYEMSRACGVWVALKLTTEVVEARELVDLRQVLAGDAQLPAFSPAPFVSLVRREPPKETERRMQMHKLPAVLEFLASRELNRQVLATEKKQLLVVSSGKAYLELRRVLGHAGVDDQVADDLGLQVFKVQAPWPLEPASLRRAVASAREVLVLEDKTSVLETQLRDVLYELPDAQRPLVWGKKGTSSWTAGVPAELPLHGELTPPIIAQALTRRLPQIKDRLPSWLLESPSASLALARPRQPHFCAGCPHGKSTRLPEGSAGFLGVGCHYMGNWIHPEGYASLSQMGGEGAAWLGVSHFVSQPHAFVNLGDGTYQHSGLLAVRAAVAARATVTYKLLFNATVAMTGGQAVEGAPGLLQVVQQLLAEGLTEVVVLTDKPQRALVQLARGQASGRLCVLPLASIMDVQRRLASTPGVTALVYDQECATELRRKRKRGRAPQPEARFVINHEVCEDCGECAKQSKCIAVTRVATAEGTKRDIDQHACNMEGSCTEAECPSFVSVRGARLSRPQGMPERQLEFAPEVAQPDQAWDIIISGVGGLGTLTLSAVLAEAARLEGRPVKTLDLAGMAQKGGAVQSHVRLASGCESPSSVARADLLIAVDGLSAGAQGVRSALLAGHTKVVLNQAAMPSSASVSFGEDSSAEVAAWLRAQAAAQHMFEFDAQLDASGVRGDPLYSGMRAVGAAYQKGWLGLRRASILQAIEQMGASVPASLRAFEEGRVAAASPATAAAVVQWLPRASATAVSTLIEERCAALARYQNKAYAERYRKLVTGLQQAEAARLTTKNLSLTRLAAEQLFRLMAHKDEYEVARLLCAPSFKARLDAAFEPGYKVAYHLAPSWLPARKVLSEGVRKIVIGQWATPALRALAALKVLRGTWLDPFKHGAEAQLAQALLSLYEHDVRQASQRLTAEDAAHWRSLLSWPQLVKGYGSVRKRNADLALSQRSGNQLATPRQGVSVRSS